MSANALHIYSIVPVACIGGTFQDIDSHWTVFLTDQCFLTIKKLVVYCTQAYRTSSATREVNTNNTESWHSHSTVSTLPGAVFCDTVKLISALWSNGLETMIDKTEFQLLCKLKLTTSYIFFIISRWTPTILFSPTSSIVSLICCTVSRLPCMRHWNETPFSARGGTMGEWDETGGLLPYPTFQGGIFV